MTQLEKQLDLIQSVVANSREARVALLGPVATTKEKTAIIQGLSQQLKLSQLLTGFISLLAKKDRLSILTEVRDAFSSVRLEEEGGVAGTLVAAEPMEETDVSTLVKAFSHKLGKKVAFRVSTDPSLLAGMKVTVNGVTYDGSLRSQLQKLRDCFVSGTPGAQA
jgi:F-type H+-transporting ATPase subunit delta